MKRVAMKVCRLLSSGLIALALAAGARAATTGEVRFDFESGDLQGWEVTEGAFDRLVSDRATYHNRYSEDNRYNKQGTYYLSTVEQQPGLPSNDRLTGVIESPVFVLAGPTLSFLLGGGDDAGTYVALCTLDGQEVRQARGTRTEVLARVTWEAPERVGQKLFLRIVDHNQNGWGHVTFDDFGAAGTLDAEATRAWRSGVADRHARQELRTRLERLNLQGLRRAIEELTRSDPEDYGRRGFLDRLEAHERALAEVAAALDEGSAAAPPRAREVGDAALAFQREALVANPLLSSQPLLYVVRPQYVAVYHAIDTLYQVGEATEGRFQPGGALKTIDLRSGQQRTLVEAPAGTVRSPCVHFDGQKILFAMRRHAKENLHLFEIGADGSGLKQLTFAAAVSDFDPAYLPDGSIVFSSTREPKYNMCSQDLGANLYRMNADGSNIHQITQSTLFENQAALMPDGRILYKRWEYVDRNFGDAHGFWTVNPDGTNQAVLWGNNKADPAAVYYPRIIPDSSGKLLCILSTHHFNMWGPLAIIDPHVATDGKAAILRTWPAAVRDRLSASDAFNCDGLNDILPKYEDPWPLSATTFLCSRQTGNGQELGLYLVDTFGNEVLLHAEAPGCFGAQPLRPSPRPPLIPSRRAFDRRPGTVFVQNVYTGTHMQGVAAGAVTQIRVVESPEKRAWSAGKWYGQGFQAPGMNWHDFTAKRILGTVPVEADGSACFAVPADTFIYFQLLDRDGMMIHSMRSGTVLQAGEQTGCVGCHESRLSAPPATGSTVPLALRREPSAIAPWYGPPRSFSYLAEVQPVFDRYCVRCHDLAGGATAPAGKAGNGKLILAGDRDPFFNASYTQLWRQGYLKAIGAGPAGVQPAYSWGSHASPLIALLRKGHQEVQLDPESLDRLVTWIDINAPYYPTYDSAYPDAPGGRSPLDDAQLGRLGQLTGVNWGAEANFGSSTGPWVSFDRPELSPCLAAFTATTDPQRQEALALIRTGKARLDERPRGDLPGFQPCAKDVQREAFYRERRTVERRNRQAIEDGQRVYDRPPEQPGTGATAGGEVPRSSR
jgi:hypothetical protein